MTPDRARRAEEDLQLRRELDGHVTSLARYLLHDWEEVAPHEQRLREQ